MSFRLRKDAKPWFKDIRGKLNYDFDEYYFCLMAGLAAGVKKDVPQSETDELVQSFPGEYRKRGRIIVALFLKTELAQMGVSLTERSALNQSIDTLVEPTSPSTLSDEGEHELNKYADGGFEVLTEWLEDRPRTLETFLPLFKRRLDEALAERSKGQP